MTIDSSVETGPIGELTKEEARQAKPDTRAFFNNDRSLMWFPGAAATTTVAARPAGIAINSSYFRDMLKEQFPDVVQGRSRAKVFLPRWDVLTKYKAFKSVTAFILHRAGLNNASPAQIGDLIPLGDYGKSIVTTVVAELAALCLMVRGADDGVMPQITCITVLAHALTMEKEVLIAACFKNGLDGVIDPVSPVTDILKGTMELKTLHFVLPPKESGSSEKKEDVESKLKRERDEMESENRRLQAERRDLQTRLEAISSSNVPQGGGYGRGGGAQDRGRGGPPRYQDRVRGGRGYQGPTGTAHARFANPGLKCSICEGVGHDDQNCPGRLPHFTMKCNRCGGIGHPVSACTTTMT